MVAVEFSAEATHGQEVGYRRVWYGISWNTLGVPQHLALPFELCAFSIHLDAPIQLATALAIPKKHRSPSTNIRSPISTLEDSYF